MYLLFSIFLSIILGYLLLMTGPLLGGLIVFGIVTGCLFRGIYLLNQINRKLSAISPQNNKAEEAYEHYLAEKK